MRTVRARNDADQRFQQLLDKLGVEVRCVSGWQLVRCVFHDENVPSLSVNVDEGAFICHACGVKGSGCVQFMRQLENRTVEDARMRVDELIGPPGATTPGKPRKRGTGRFRPRFKNQL